MFARIGIMRALNRGRPDPARQNRWPFLCANFTCPVDSTAWSLTPGDQEAPKSFRCAP